MHNRAVDEEPAYFFLFFRVRVATDVPETAVMARRFATSSPNRMAARTREVNVKWLFNISARGSRRAGRAYRVTSRRVVPLSTCPSVPLAAPCRRSHTCTSLLLSRSGVTPRLFAPLISVAAPLSKIHLATSSRPCIHATTIAVAISGSHVLISTHNQKPSRQINVASLASGIHRRVSIVVRRANVLRCTDTIEPLDHYHVAIGIVYVHRGPSVDIFLANVGCPHFKEPPGDTEMVAKTSTVHWCHPIHILGANVAACAPHCKQPLCYLKVTI